MITILHIHIYIYELRKTPKKTKKKRKIVKKPNILVGLCFIGHYGSWDEGLTVNVCECHRLVGYLYGAANAVTIMCLGKRGAVVYGSRHQMQLFLKIRKIYFKASNLYS